MVHHEPGRPHGIRHPGVLGRMYSDSNRLLHLGKVGIMKTGKKRQRDSRYLCKVYLDSWLQRLIWWAFRRYLLNEDHYVVSQLFSGSRRTSFNASYCLKENAVARRIYLEPRKRPAQRMSSILEFPLRDVG